MRRLFVISRKQQMKRDSDESSEKVGDTDHRCDGELQSVDDVVWVLAQRPDTRSDEIRHEDIAQSKHKCVEHDRTSASIPGLSPKNLETTHV